MKKKKTHLTPDTIIIDRTTTTGHKAKIPLTAFKRDENSIPISIINQSISDITAPFNDEDKIDDL